MIQFIITLGVAIVLGVWAIILAIKQLYPGRITFVQENCIALFDSIVKNLPELAINYKRKPIKENLVLLKGFLINTGIKDISETMVEQKLAINLPIKYKWLTAKVISTSNNLRAHVEIFNKTDLIFNTGLFRRKEFIRFEALAEVPMSVNSSGNSRGNSQEKELIRPTQKLTNALKFTHRIADTRKVHKKALPDPKNDVLGIIFSAIIAFFIASTFFIQITFFGLPAKTNFIIQTEDNKAIEVSVMLKIDGNLEIKGVNETYKKVLPVSEFLSKKLSPKIIFDPDFIILLIVLASLGLLSLFATFMFYLAYRRNKKLNNMIVNVVGI